MKHLALTLALFLASCGNYPRVNPVPEHGNPIVPLDRTIHFNELAYYGFRANDLHLLKQAIIWGFNDLELDPTDYRIEIVKGFNDVDSRGRYTSSIRTIEIHIIQIMPDLYMRGLINETDYDRAWMQQMLDVVFHEMVHAMQYDSGMLRWDGNWNGKYYDRDKIAWHQRPWEIHAVNKSRDMVERFIWDYFGRWDYCNQCYNRDMRSLF